MPARELKLGRPDVCVICGSGLAAGTRAWWDQSARTVTCTGCWDGGDISPTGVYVIDTKDWKGKVQIQTPWLGAPKLLIRGRDCTKLLDGLDRQVAAVRSALDRDSDEKVPIWGALCFTKADLPFLRTQRLRGHLLLYRKALAKRLNADGPLQWPVLEQLASHLAAVLPPAR